LAPPNGVAAKKLTLSSPSRRRRRVGPDAHVPAFDLFDVECASFPCEIAELAMAVRAHVEIREQV
jgi:hypothetical protein